MPYALALGIEVEHRARPMKSMAQIFTGKGKGSAIREQAKPYKVLATEKSETLGLCMESVLSPTAETPETPEQPALPGIVRVRDCDLLPEHYDPISGEHFTPRAKALTARQSADQWVAEALLARRGT